MVKDLLERFTRKNCKKQTKKCLKYKKKKKMNRKVDKPYDKQKAYDNSFNSWIDKKYIFR